MMTPEMRLRSELGQHYRYRCKSNGRGGVFYNLDGCLVPEVRNGNQAHHTPVGLHRLRFHRSGDCCLTASMAGYRSPFSMET